VLREIVAQPGGALAVVPGGGELTAVPLERPLVLAVGVARDLG
jgi:hypothetical protein